MLACMLTCRTLYEVGVQRLLSLPLHIPINNTIIPLCEYILTQFPHRSRHLRELKLGHPGNEQLSSITSSTVDLLARVLSGAQDLRTVTIYNINQAFISDSTLSDALSHLKGINELNVMSPSYPLFKALEKMDASLKKLRVDFYSYNRQPIDPLPKIAPFNITLENLSISFVKFSRTPKLEETVVFPRVHVLSIKQSPLTPLETLIHSFPDVRRLTLFMSHHSNVLLEIPAQACRESNQAAQHRKPWSSLNYVQADALSLYLLGLDSMVHHVDIRDITTPVMHLVPMVLLDIRPTRLALSIPTRNCDIEALPVLLGQALRHLQLTHFFVTLDLSYSYPCLEEVYVSSMELEHLHGS